MIIIYHCLMCALLSINDISSEQMCQNQADITTVEDKYDRIANYFINQIRTTKQLFQKKKRKDNIPRGMPPVAGN
jgi:hypothetical protein